MASQRIDLPPVPAGARVVVTLFRPDQLSRLQQVATALHERGALIRLLALELETFELLRDHGAECDLVDRFTTAEDHAGVDRKAIELAHGWFRTEAAGRTRDPTRYSGLSLGSLLTWEFSYFFAEVLRCRTNARAALDELRPEMVVHLVEPPGTDRSILLHPTENFHHDAIDALSGERGIHTARILPPGELPAAARCGPQTTCAPTAVPAAPSGATPRPLEAGPVLVTGLGYLGDDLVRALTTDRRDRLLVLDECPRPDRPGVLPTGLERYNSPSVERTAARAAHLLPQRWNRRRDALLGGLDRSAASITSLGCVRDRIAHAFEVRLPRALRNHLLVRRLLRAEEVRSAVLHDDVTEFSKTIALACRGRGVPSLVLLHGAVGHPIGALPLTADRVAVYGPHFVDWFVSHGVARERIEVTGSSRFSAIDTAAGNGAADDERSLLGIAPGRRAVVVALQHCNRATWFANVHWPHLEWRRLVGHVIDAAEQIGDLHLLIKLHPAAEDGALWQTWLERRETTTPLTLLQHHPTDRLLAVADLLITGWSTLAVEAALARIPVITANFTGRPTPMDYGAFGLSLPVDRPEQLAPAFVRALGSGSDPTGDPAFARLLAYRGAAAVSKTVAAIERLSLAPAVSR